MVEIRKNSCQVPPIQKMHLKFLGGDRIRTCSLQVMGLMSRPIPLPRFWPPETSNSRSNETYYFFHSQKKLFMNLMKEQRERVWNSPSPQWFWRGPEAQRRRLGIALTLKRRVNSQKRKRLRTQERINREINCLKSEVGSVFFSQSTLQEKILNLWEFLFFSP